MLLAVFHKTADDGDSEFLNEGQGFTRISECSVTREPV